MFIFQFRTAVREEKIDEKRLEEAVKDFAQTNSKFAKESQQMTPQQSLDLAMSAKYRNDFKSSFLKFGTENQWNRFVTEYERLQTFERQKDVDRKMTASAVLKSIPHKIAEGQAYADKAAKEATEDNAFFRPPKN